jgi:MFS family permease
VNAAKQGCLQILGPVVALDHLGGAAAWGAILTTIGVGYLVGGAIMLRLRPRRTLRAGVAGLLVTFLLLFGLAIPLPLAALIALAALAGVGSEIFGVMWDTTLQQELPHDKLSRLSSYDAVGSFGLLPVGFALAGPIAAVIGDRATLLGGGLLCLLVTIPIFFVRDVQQFERRSDDEEPSSSR